MRADTTRIPVAVVTMALGLLVAGLAPARADAEPFAGCLTSEAHPIEVCYEVADDAAYAAVALAEVEALWTLLVDGVGMPTPWRVGADGTPEQGAELLILDLGGQAAGYTEGIADVPTTPYADCAVRMHIDRTMPESYLPSLLGHQVGHAVAMADECTEPLPHAVNTFLEFLHLENSGASIGEYLASNSGTLYYETFQGHPELPLDHFDYQSPTLRYFNYGHGLFLLFLDQRYGAGDGTLIAAASRAGRQDGTVGFGMMGPYLMEGENEPDLYDGIDTVLREQGSDFWEAIGEFAVWRLLTGERDDGHHLRHAGWFPPVAIDTEVAPADLPVKSAMFTATPAETGTVYVSLPLAALPASARPQHLVFRILAEAPGAWRLAAVQRHAQGEADVTAAVLEDGDGALSVPVVDGVNEIVFAATWLGDRDHDLDARDWAGTPVSFDLEELPPPTISRVTPGGLEQGSQGQAVTLQGAGFTPDVTVGFGDGVTVTGLSVEPYAIAATVDVAADAALGPRDVVVRCADGRETTVPNGITIVAPAAPIVSSLSPAFGYADDQALYRVGGRNFAEGVTLAVSGGGVSVIDLRRHDDTALTVTLGIAADAAPGLRDVTVSNPDGGSVTLTEAFEVLPAFPAPFDAGSTGGGEPGADGGSGGSGLSGGGETAGGGAGGGSGAGGSGGGGGCSAGAPASTGPAGGLVLLLLLLVVGLVRHQATPTNEEPTR